MANPLGAAGDAWFDLSVAGQVQGLPALPGKAPGQVPPAGTLYARYPGLIGGPVDSGYHAQDPAFTSQRTLWAGSSLEEVVGTDTRGLSNHFYWTWYDMASAGFKNWVLISNPGANPVFYRIKIAGVPRASGQIPPGQDVTPEFPGAIGGPVEVEAWADMVGGSVPAYVMASQRVLTNGDTAFNEVAGIPLEGLSSDYLWTWYDMTGSAKDWVLIANPGGASLYWQIFIGGAPAKDDGGTPIAAGGNVTPTFPGKIGGPVEVKTFSDPGHTVPATSIASQRSLWGPSFEEVPGLSRAAATSKYHWTWYDMQSTGSQNWVLIANPGGSNLYWQVFIGSSPVAQDNGTPIPPGKNVTPTFPGKIGGPVEVRTFSDAGHTAPASSIASQRVLWSGYFNEVLGTVFP